jgi:hypothetical protein
LGGFHEINTVAPRSSDRGKSGQSGRCYFIEGEQIMKLLRRITPALAIALSSVPVIAAPLIVIDAHGGSFKAGQKIDSAKPITLKEGERVTLIAPDGKTITLRGKFSGLPMTSAPAATDPKQALAALMANRNARTSRVGAVRGDSELAPLPQPWLIDVSTPGERCLRPGQQPIWWRPEAAASQKFSLLPSDQSWRSDFEWVAGQHAIPAPPLAKFDGQTSFVIRMGQQEHSITVNLVPTDLDGSALASWMIEKGCIQQADALLRQIDRDQAAAK